MEPSFPIGQSCSEGVAVGPTISNPFFRFDQLCTEGVAVGPTISNPLSESASHVRREQQQGPLYRILLQYRLVMFGYSFRVCQSCTEGGVVGPPKWNPLSDSASHVRILFQIRLVMFGGSSRARYIESHLETHDNFDCRLLTNDALILRGVDKKYIILQLLITTQTSINKYNLKSEKAY